MKKFVLLLLFTTFCLACKEESNINFKSNYLEFDDTAYIEIDYPTAEGNSTAAQLINTTISNYIVNALNFEEDSISDSDIAKAASKFNNEYKAFQIQFSDESIPWEASIEGELLYTSALISSISINTYISTGGAHGNDYTKLFNFNNATGKLLNAEDVLELNSNFMKLAQQYFEQEVMKKDENIKDYFFGEAFKLPENIGLNEYGLIMLYNQYEIASYAQGYTEFLIPLKELEPYLKYH